MSTRVSRVRTELYKADKSQYNAHRGMGGAQVITERATPHKRKPANQPPSLQQENVGSEEVSALWSHAFIP